MRVWGPCARERACRSEALTPSRGATGAARLPVGSGTLSLGRPSPPPLACSGPAKGFWPRGGLRPDRAGIGTTHPESWVAELPPVDTWMMAARTKQQRDHPEVDTVHLVEFHKTVAAITRFRPEAQYCCALWGTSPATQWMSAMRPLQADESGYSAPDKWRIIHCPAGPNCRSAR